jgi:hypothetical protein
MFSFFVKTLFLYLVLILGKILLPLKSIDRLKGGDKKGNIPRSVSKELSISMNVVQNYWAYGLYPSSGVQEKETEGHYVSETGSVSVLRCMGQDKTYSVGS